MKKLFLASIIFATAAACMVPLSNTAERTRQDLRASQQAWQDTTQRIAEIQTAQAGQRSRIEELQRKIQDHAITMDSTLVDGLLATDRNPPSAEIQKHIMALIKQPAGVDNDFVLVSKAALAKATFRPLQTFPNSEKLSSTARAVLAITPPEERALETAFAEAFETIGIWAKANVQREEPSGDMLVRYTIPTDSHFQDNLTNRLFTKINAAIGVERGELLTKYFLYHRKWEDDAISDRTNVFSIHRISAPPGLGSRDGWKWENSEAINSYPEPIKPHRFPCAFYFVFPGGWQEVARREGFELPEEFRN